MKLTILGAVLIPLGLYLFFREERKLLLAAVLTCGLTGSSVLMLGDTALQPSYWFALLWMAKRLLVRKRIRCSMGEAYFFFFGFVIVSVLSLVMPLLLPADVQIMNVDGNIAWLRFTSANITQLMYLLICAAFFYLLAGYMKEEKNYRQIYEAYMWGVVITCLITMYQLAAYAWDLPFDPIFKMGLHRKFGPLIFWDKRVSGPCLEASMLAYYIVPALPLCIRDRRPWVRYGVTAFLLLVGVRSGSSTFLVGAALWLVLEAVRLLERAPRQFRTKLGVCVAAAGLLVLAVLPTGKGSAALSKVGDLVDKFMEKVQMKHLSGVERSEAFALLIRAFLRSPVLGVGFGSSRGKDLLCTWLANTGLVGMTLLAFFLYKSFRQAGKNRGLMFACITVWFCMFASVAEPYNLFIWILMALAARHEGGKDYGIQGRNKSCEKIPASAHAAAGQG